MDNVFFIAIAARSRVGGSARSILAAMTDPVSLIGLLPKKLSCELRHIHEAYRRISATFDIFSDAGFVLGI